MPCAFLSRTEGNLGFPLFARPRRFSPREKDGDQPAFFAQTKKKAGCDPALNLWCSFAVGPLVLHHRTRRLLPASSLPVSHALTATETATENCTEPSSRLRPSCSRAETRMPFRLQPEALRPSATRRSGSSRNTHRRPSLGLRGSQACRRG